MSSAFPFIGEIMLFGGNFAPRGWAFCNGQLLSIAQNTALFSLLGTTFGGDGQTTFGLPDLQGRIPVGVGTSTQLGEEAGFEQITLTVNQLPSHTHAFQAASPAASAGIPNGNTVADTSAAGALIYRAAAGSTMAALSDNAVDVVGQTQPHENRMPVLAVSYVIAVEGIYPSRN